MRGKIPTQKSGGQGGYGGQSRRKIKIWHLILAGLVAMAASVPRLAVAKAEGCPDLRVVFARGSGGERWTDKNYLEFKSTIETKLTNTDISYEFIDLDYPAVGIDDIGVLAGAWAGAGDAYEFGDSVKSGVKNLDKLVNDDSCVNTKYVVGGYSQGAMVVSQALGSLKSDRLVYAATFGDPKLYLPEGKGLMPAACRGENLSDYRMYVPDCQAYKGLLGAYVPYEPESLTGKVGTWCNKRDIFCSSRLSISDHTGYVTDDLYEDASRVIYDKICKAFGVENRVSSPHDTAILIDSTGSMYWMIEDYKAEALRLAQETLAAGGRVALYDYRDLDDPYQPVQHCDFETCTLESVKAGLDTIVASGGGDTSESLLSASYKVMTDLEWKYGSTKSLVALTDADFLAPDRDGMTFDEVVAVSKRIDPVNFYIITTAEFGDSYLELASATDGKVVTNFDELSLLTDYIMERYDSLPRVEETEPVERPTLEVTRVENDGTEVRVKFATTGTSILVALNDAVLGMVEGDEVVVGELDPALENVLRLVPLGEDVRGDGVEVRLGEGYGGSSERADETTGGMPKTPNTGKASGVRR